MCFTSQGLKEKGQTGLLAFAVFEFMQKSQQKEGKYKVMPGNIFFSLQQYHPNCSVYQSCNKKEDEWRIYPEEGEVEEIKLLH